MKIIVPIEPGLVAANRRLIPQHTSGKPTGRLILSPSYRSGLDEMAYHVRQTCIRTGWRKTAKPVVVAVHVYWPQSRGDHDSCTKAACDALEIGAAIYDDAQIEESRSRRYVDKAHPRIEIEVTAVED